MSEEQPGTLYVVATPIGNLADLSMRAIETLRQVDVIAAEDTRHSRYLLQQHAIDTPCISLHEHNEQQRSEVLLQRLLKGESVALISDAGTPLISDPGYRLVSLLKSHGLSVIPIPGACAVIAALSASGLRCDSFTFEGFLPSKANALRQQLESLQHETRTMIFYESPKRVLASLQVMVEVLGEQRLACLARELTKLHETIRTASLVELRDWVQQDLHQQKGEIVLLVEGAQENQRADQQEIDRVLQLMIAELPVKKAASLASSILGISKNEAYQQALKLQHK
ncbi:MAG: 16S rRNA (cytidine(1402)-2'-O)-methyltransferase [Methylophaga sp.]|nr:16S rRNA (cytidine(1402)-2'-O)-methyltransferase [Methylophaga sp.]